MRTKVTSRTAIIGISILSIVVLLFLLPPLLTPAPETDVDIERITISEFPDGLYLTQGRTYSLVVFYSDTWHNTPISNATVSAVSDDTNIVEISSVGPDIDSAGTYLVTIIAKYPSSTYLTIIVTKLNYESQDVSVAISVHPAPTPPIPPPIPYGLPFACLVLVIGYLHYRKQTRKVREASDAELETTLEEVNGAPGEI